MGIGPDERALIETLELPQGFAVCELGSIIWHRGYRKKPGWWQRPAKHLYAELGAGRYEAIDANGQGTLTIDLNMPLEHRSLFQAFDLVTDWGTTEHVFDICQAWCTMHRLCKPGGVIAFVKPTQGYEDHGFYNVHPTFIKDLARVNRYDIGSFELAETDRGTLIRGWMRKPAGDFRRWEFPTQRKYLASVKLGETGPGPTMKRQPNIRKGK